MAARRWFAVVAVFLAGLTRQAGAQLGCAGATCTVEISMPVNQILRLTLSSTSVNLGSPTETDYQAGFRDVAGPAVNVAVKANRAFSVQVGGLTPTFGYVGPLANPAKPASNLRWATSAAGLAGTPNHMGATLGFISSGAGTVNQPLYLRTLWTFATDVPGTYSLVARFTLSAP